MSAYYLIENIGTVQSKPALVIQATALDLPKPSASLQVVVSGTSGSCSATVQWLGGNDGVNFINLGSVVATTSNAAVANGTNGAVSQVPWLFYAAYLSAVSGTGASVNAIMGV